MDGLGVVVGLWVHLVFRGLDFSRGKAKEIVFGVHVSRCVWVHVLCRSVYLSALPASLA